MDKRPRIVGVDFGTKRVGLALSDPLQMFARPLGTFTADRAVDEIKRIAEEDGIEVLVVGWPLLPDGSEGKMTHRVQEFVNRLRKSFRNIEIVLWDERYTSQMARTLHAEARPGTRARKGEGDLDAFAAAVILQDYLER